MRKNILLISILFWHVCVMAQPQVRADLSYIHNAQPIVVNTFDKVFKIVHIGDSHIQADWFSGKVRELIQQQFGNAGKGLLFPYKQIKTNGPRSFTSAGEQPVQANKIIKCKTTCDVGIAAYNAILPTGTDISFTLKNDSGIQFISLLYQAENPYAISINNNKSDDDYAIQQTNSYIISSCKNAIGQTFSIHANSFAILNGIISNNGNPGVLYYTIGANGATVNNYNNSPLFFEQLQSLEPDLVIVSLGTNESMSDITPDSFALQLQTFQNNLQKSIGNTGIVLYTTPADNFKREAHTIRKKVKGKWRNRKVISYQNNTKLIELKDAMINFCNTYNFMYWDLFEAMGGKESMQNWVQSGYAAKDHVHFSKGGYELQGTLFFEALQRVLTNP